MSCKLIGQRIRQADKEKATPSVQNFALYHIKHRTFSYSSPSATAASFEKTRPVGTSSISSIFVH